MKHSYQRHTRPAISSQPSHSDTPISNCNSTITLIHNFASPASITCTLGRGSVSGALWNYLKGYATAATSNDGSMDLWNVSASSEESIATEGAVFNLDVRNDVLEWVVGSGVLAGTFINIDCHAWKVMELLLYPFVTDFDLIWFIQFDITRHHLIHFDTIVMVGIKLYRSIIVFVCYNFRLWISAYIQLCMK